MNNIFSAELYKLKFSVTFYVCLLASVAFTVLGGYGDSSQTSMHMAVAIAGNITLFIAIVIASLACDDVEKNTMKNLISSGHSRFHIYMGKVMAAMAIGLIFFIVDGVASCAVGYVLNGFGHIISPISFMENFAAQIGLVLVYSTIFFGLSSIVRSAKFGMILSVLFAMGAAMIPWLIGLYITHSDLSAFSIDTLANNIEALQFSGQTFINFAIYGGLAFVLNFMGYIRFKREEV